MKRGTEPKKRKILCLDLYYRKTSKSSIFYSSNLILIFFSYNLTIICMKITKLSTGINKLKEKYFDGTQPYKVELS